MTASRKKATGQPNHSRRPSRLRACAMGAVLGAAACLGGAASAQSAARPYAPGTPQPPSDGSRPPDAVVAQDADWRALRDPDQRTGGFDNLRFIPLDDDGTSFVSLGVESRVGLEFYDNELWGANPGRDSYGNTRLNMSLGVQFGDRARMYVALKHGQEIDRRFFSPGAEEDNADLHAAFAELAFGDLLGGAPADVFLRVGRQELHFAQGRAVSIREGPNVRDDFDGITLRARTGRRVTDLVAAYAVEDGSGAFDNDTAKRESLFGVYSSGPLVNGMGLDIFAFRQRRALAPSNEGPGQDRRWTLGARMFSPGPPRGLIYELETTFQTGRLRQVGGGEASIEAFSIAGQLGYRFDATPWKLQPGMRFGYTSGDNRAGDGKIGTFKPPYPPGRYFGDTIALGPGNLLGGWLYLAAEPVRKLSAELHLRSFWRASDGDGIYARPGFPLRGSAGTSNYLGSELGLTLNYALGHNLRLYLDGGHFRTGSYFDANPPGRAITHLEAQLIWGF